MNNKLLCVLPAALLSLAGCASAIHDDDTRPRTTIADLIDSPTGAIAVDGNTSDWPGDSAAVADADYLYLRFTFPGRAFTLQAAPKPIVVMIDADADAATGQHPLAKGLKSMGVDFELIFSGDETQRRGVAAYSVSNDGVFTQINPYDLDLTCAPTVAADWYELRVSRTSPALAAIPSPGLRSMGRATVSIGVIGADGHLEAYSDPSEVALAPANTSTPLADATIPAKPAGAIRLVSWNIERSAPTKDPQSFRRILQVIQPDVIDFQEWDTGSAEDLKAWMTQWVSSEVDWNVAKASGGLAEGGGVAIVSAYPLNMKLASPPLGGAGGSPVRFISATVDGPFGQILVGSTHLKCCGHLESPEDQRRLAEADTVNRAFLFDGAPAFRVISGDLNLVGSRPPVERLGAGIDSDGSDLSIANPGVLGDRTFTTWSNRGEVFTPGRLDYVLYSDSTLQLAHAFVLDTRRLSDAALARLGLDRNDSAASDHMPVVIDLLPSR